MIHVMNLQYYFLNYYLYHFIQYHGYLLYFLLFIVLLRVYVFHYFIILNGQKLLLLKYSIIDQVKANLIQPFYVNTKLKNGILNFESAIFE